jgi:hypothetical protein
MRYGARRPRTTFYEEEHGTDGDHEAVRRRGAEAAALFAEVGCRLGRSRAAVLAAELVAKSC